MTDKTSHSADGPEEPTSLPMDDNLCAPLALLWRAYACAQDAHAAPWDFALEIGKLYEAGLTITDLRWLVVKGFVEHGAETSVYGDAHRSFTRSEGFNFLPTTCVVLTKKGTAFACQVLQTAAAANAAEEPLDGPRKAEPGSEIPPGNGEAQPEATLKPHWDPVRRVLSLGHRIVKQFHVPAGNQEDILSAFQEEGWPEHIDDPLTGNHGVEPKTRLNNAIYRLNRNQMMRLIRFHGNGNGNGVRWSLVRTHNGAAACAGCHGTDHGCAGANHRRPIDV
jgi:hypothetical protein